MKHALKRFLYLVFSYYPVTGYGRSEDWFRKAIRKKEFFGKPLEAASQTNYVKLKKVVRIIEQVEDFRKTHGLKPEETPILDIGCGSSIVYARCLALLGYPIVGVDIIPEAVQEAREKAKSYPNIRVFCMGGKDFLERRAMKRFRVVLVMDTLEHMEAPLEICHGIFDCLQSPGILLAVVPDGYSELEILYNPLATLALKHLLNERVPGTYHIQRFSRRGMRRMLEQSGFRFKLLTSFYTTRFPFGLMFLLGFRGELAYLNTWLAERFPTFMTNSWLVAGLKGE